MKRIISIVLAALMLMAICPLAFAEETITSVDIINADVTPTWGWEWDDGLDYELADDTGFYEYDQYWFDEDTYESDFDYMLPGHEYSKCWEFVAEDGYAFSDDVVFTINGSTALVDSNYSGVGEDGAYCYVWMLPVEAVESTDSEIAFATVDDVDLLPVVGDKAGDHLNAAVDSARYGIDDYSWYCDTDDESMTDEDVFEAGKEYSMWIDLKAKDGYDWNDSDLVVLVNGAEDSYDYWTYDDEYPEYVTIWTNAAEAVDVANAPEAFLLYDGENGMEEGIYRVDMNTGMPVMTVKTFGGATLFAMEKVGGKYYGYDDSFNYYIINGNTWEVEYAAEYDTIGEPTVNDMTLNKDEGVLYGINAGNNTLFTIDASTGETTVVKEYEFSPITIAYADGAFYCTEYDTANIWKIDAETLEETKIGAFAEDEFYLAYIQTMDYNPADGKLYTLGYEYSTKGFVAAINLDGTVEYRTTIGTIEYGGLCFPDDGELLDVPLTGIELDQTELELKMPGKTSAKLKVIYTPAGATNKAVTWESSDTSVATVENGVVTAVAPGEATITVTSDEGGFTATCAVKVEAVSFLFYEDFENFDENNWTMIDADGDGVNWVLQEQNASGGIKIYQGDYCITSESYINDYGALTPDNWLISEPFTATADAELSWYDVGQDGTYCYENYSVYVLPADYTNVSDAVEVWNGTSESDYNQRIVSLGAYAGQSIRIAFRHYDVTDMFRLNIDLITVTGNEDAEIIPVTGVELDKTEAEVAEKGTVQLTATVLPANATNKMVAWTSSDENIATVKNGVVTGVKAGEATITVTTVDGGFTATCKVTVVKSEYILYEDFETDSVTDWSVLDADGDGYAWELGSVSSQANVYEGEYCAMSASYDNDEGALTPDNWLISPVFTPDETSVLSWYVAGQDPAYAAEHYGVYVLPADAEDVTEGTEIFNGTATASYVNKTVSLADYAGQEIMIAFRHYDVTDMFYLNLDLITVTGKGEVQPPVNEYTVTFVDGLTNETIATVKVEEGKDVEFPEAPEHEGYTFTGWDKDGKNITADTTITALYEEIVEPPVETIFGDVNGDGKITTSDAVYILKACAGMLGEIAEEDIPKLDINRNGKLDTQDAVQILKYCAEMITEL